MVFSSVVFLCVFFPLVMLLYFLCPGKWRNFVLLAASLVFYAWGEPVYVLIMLFSTVFDYVNGRLIDHFRERGKPKLRKLILLISVAGNLGILCFFKYTDFLIENINAVTGMGISLLELALPIGISFYTFQTMSYTIDVYLEKVPVQKNIIHFGTYVTLFPQLIAGPIVRYKDVQRELDCRRETLEDVTYGLCRFVLGLGKKVLLANRAGAIYEQIQGQELSMSLAWLGAVLFAFQIYFDFSGYSDMAIGLGRMFGFRFPENFNDPYTSSSITEFWRRWHISLGTWFREYVYIPLGGNRRGLGRQLINISIVWLLTGLWHGASWNYVLWGAMFGILLILEKTFLLKLLDRLPAFVGHLYTLLFVLVSWVIFANETMTDMLAWLRAMFVPRSFWDPQTTYLLLTHGFLLAVCVLFCTALPGKLYRKLAERPALCQGLQMVAVPVLLTVCLMFLVAETYNPFLYFRF